jgi:glycosyltransferase involved in cell wall biosynthesis
MAICTEKFSILHLDTEKRFGGGQKQALILATGLKDEGIKSIFVLKKDSLLKDKIKNEFEYVVFPFRGEWDLQTAIRILFFVRKRKISIVHSHTAHGAFYTAFLKLFGIKVLHTRRVSYPVKGNLNKVKYRLHDAVVGVCLSIKNDLSFIDKQKLHLIPSAVDIRKNDISKDKARVKLGLPLGEKVILNVGNILPMKGQKMLLDAFSMLNEGTLLIAGGGDRKILQKTIDDKRLKNVHLLGFVEDIQDFYKVADVLVISSQQGEGSPAVLKEAFLFGVPVVATDVGGIREIGEGACVIVPPNSARDIFQAVEHIFKDEELKSRLVAEGKRRAMNFSPQNMVKKYMDVYKSL